MKAVVEDTHMLDRSCLNTVSPASFFFLVAKKFIEFVLEFIYNQNTKEVLIIIIDTDKTVSMTEANQNFLLSRLHLEP